MRVLVTGCNGYIGSHTAKHLAQHGYDVHGLDILPYTHNDVSRYLSRFIHGDIQDLTHINVQYDCVVHLAALVDVVESNRIPSWYYKTNIIGTDNVIRNTQYDNFVFSSTAAAFDPISPYGRSKVCAEDIVKQLCKSYTIFRFFNVGGSDGEFYQIREPTHMIGRAALAALGRTDLVINGTNYDTRDGTCLRDYVDVEDIACAIQKAVDIPANTEYECLSTGVTHSNLEVVEAMRTVSNTNFEVQFGPRRENDIVVVEAPNTSSYFTSTKTLDQICESTYNVLKSV